MARFFQCQRCTACCRWPGEVRIREDEVAAIAGYLGLGVRDFVHGHTRLTGNRQGLSLLEHEDGTCVWLEGVDCRLQPVKPLQCREFPNTWNFPGWRDVCRAVEVEELAEGGTRTEAAVSRGR
ncbi:MAG: YkgJ family cysteine cluster protein [Verrucomicrobiales bacterium]